MDGVITLTEYELNNMMSSVAERTARTILIKMGFIKPTMKIAECYRLAGSRRKVDRAVRERKLKFVKKGVNTLINREEFELWLQKCEWK